MEAPKEVVDLVERFNRNIDSYKKGNYNETQVRVEYIDPLFLALGWDVHNRSGYAEAYKDVIHEYSQKTMDSVEAPDYCFRIGGTRKFFVEAKKPSVNLNLDISPSFQLRRYAWSAKLPLSILTDFEEFAVYDCRVQPKNNDKPSVARVIYYNYSDYLNKWNEIYTTFSKDAVLKGSFDKYAETNKGKKGTAEVDEAFLKEIEGWRDILARNIAIRNPGLSTRELNYAVQVTIDRIIFLRICEDRGIEDYGQLMKLQNGANIYQRMLQIFKRADEKYNSGLFHFDDEKSRPESPNTLTPELLIDDKTLKEIVKNLYYPESSYEFSVLPADILGQVYEQFLGKVIRLTGGHHAVIDDKPEVKKAGGVYYTPTYIVDYIVKNTLGKMLGNSKLSPFTKGGSGGAEGDSAMPNNTQTPEKVSKLKILDPACGSGSFLLGAYQYLLDWHRDYYTAEIEKHGLKHFKKNIPVYQAQNGEWRLTINERKRILLNNIYGVDIDQQAVEVTKLSLLLKVLEGETEESITNQYKLFKERALPDLSSNIKCGNSLIGPDFYDQMDFNFLDDEEKLRINVFDWNAEFKDIMNDGGFDVVIGNPPYIKIQAMKEWAPQEVSYYKEYYKSAGKGNYDIYVVFIEKGFSLLNSNGKLGFILPNKFMLTDYGMSIREHLLSKNAVETIIDFSHSQVFDNVTTYTCILLLTNTKNLKIRYSKVLEPHSIVKNGLEFLEVDNDYFIGKTWVFTKTSEKHLFERLKSADCNLIDIASINRGSSSGNDKVFMLIETDKSNFYLDENNNEVYIEPEMIRTPIFASDFSRYNFNKKHNYRIIFPYQYKEDNSIELFSESELCKCFPNTYKYLQINKKILESRKQYREWFGYSAPRSLRLHDTANIIIPLLANQGLFSLYPEKKKDYCLMASGGFSVTVNNEIEPEYILGLLNSKLLFWYLNKISNDFRDGWITCTKQYMGNLPIKLHDKTTKLKLNQLVNKIIDYKSNLEKIHSPREKEFIKNQVIIIDKQIDQLVYQLYGLTDEEIKIVEGGDNG